MTNIKCPKCGRVLGETNKSLDAILICKGCKQKVSINLDVLTTDYFNFNANNVNERKNK